MVRLTLNEISRCAQFDLVLRPQPKNVRSHRHVSPNKRRILSCVTCRKQFGFSDRTLARRPSQRAVAHGCVFDSFLIHEPRVIHPCFKDRSMNPVGTIDDKKKEV